MFLTESSRWRAGVGVALWLAVALRHLYLLASGSVSIDSVGGAVRLLSLVLTVPIAGYVIWEIDKGRRRSQEESKNDEL
jgi:hypothetical protein